MSTPLKYQVTNPATGEVGEQFPFATDAEVEQALADAAAGFKEWKQRSLEERCAVVKKVSELFIERADALAALITTEMGKRHTEGVGEAKFSGMIFGYYADNAAKLLAPKPLEGRTAKVEYLPTGPIVGVMPWNFPYYQVARFVAPNLVAGNTVILKHSETCPTSSQAIADILEEAGVPKGVFTNLYATHEQVQKMIEDDRVQGVSVTGSERAGRAVAEAAGRSLKKVVLELGGSDPYIILDSDDVKAAAKTAWTTRMGNAGQACNSNKRLIVHESIHDEFVAELKQLGTGLKPRPQGDDSAEGFYSPMSSRGAAETLNTQVQDAVSKGATLHVGGELLDDTTAYFSPALLTGITPQMRAYKEELFGPVAVVYKISSDDEAVELANSVDLGLGGAVFSTDSERAIAVAERLEAGMVAVNTPFGRGADLPVGGTKRSGFGRELGPLGIEEFLNKRMFYVEQ